MNSLAVLVLALISCSVAMAGYRRSYYHPGYKTHLGGASYGYGYRPLRYATHAKPVYHPAPAPIVYAHKSHSKPYLTHYVKPTYHHPEPHHVVVSKPAYYLGGHAHGLSHGHGLSYKPVSHGYVHRPAVYAHKPYHHYY